ncbi:hypothetical protein OIU77_031294 [Salix suchowensis]|uniref:Uncharacterized protein n=1 Tax=Salix suchowensis TaxID=1278906 RepID=A0ABQ9BH56_9ROSI|nr:hypothetical protein OIU77_031294 [Salix suchowensis]
MKTGFFLQSAFIDLGSTLERSKSIIGSAGCIPKPSFVLLKSAIDHQKLGSARNVNGKCALAATFVGFQKLMAIGLKNGLVYTGNPVGVIREKFRPHQIHVYTQQECFKKSTLLILAIFVLMILQLQD